MPIEQEPQTITEEAPDGSQTDFEITTAQGDEGTLIDEIVDALFDDDTTPTEVTYADTDGDGKIDAGAIDSDGDGQLDLIAGDTDGDGKVDAVSADTDGDGKLDVIAVDTDGDGVIDATGEDTDGDGQLDTVMLDTDGDGEMDVTYTDADGDGEFEVVSADGLPTDDEISTNSVEFTVGEDGFPLTDEEVDDEYTAEDGTEFAEGTSGGYVSGPSIDPAAEPFYAAPDIAASGTDPSTTDTADTSAADQQVHADAASEAQAQADEFVAKGDYAAAAEAREVAENEAYAGGDSSMLGASDSTDLDNAAYKQGLADDYRTQQADHIAAGDYEAAKEDAQNVAYQTGDADYLASGSDHTGQADQDAYNLDNAVYQEKNADYFADNADWYAQQGNTDAAQSSLDQAAGYQQSADTYAATADPVSPMYDVDPSSAVDAGGSYDMSSVDTGFDAGVEMSTPVADYSGSDDGTV